MIITGKINEIKVRSEGERVLVFSGSHLIMNIPYQAALQVARAIQVKARQAEELANAEKIIYDQAILTRLGLPVGLTSNPALLKKAANEAAWNTNLRRYIQPDRAKGIASQSIVGTPKLIQHPPKETDE